MQSFNQQQRLNMITEQLQNVAFPETTTFGLTEMQQQQHVAFPQRQQQQGLWKQLDNQVYGQDQFEIVDSALTKTLKKIQHQQHHQQQQQLQLQQQLQQQVQQQVQQQQQVQEQLLSMEPTMMIRSGAVAQRTFRIVSEEFFFSPKSINVCINGRICLVTGLCKNNKLELVQFRKSYQLPSYVIPCKYTIFFTEHGKFIIEFPIVQGLNGQSMEQSTVEQSYVQQQYVQQQLAGLQQHEQSEIVDIAVQGLIVKQQPITTLPGLTFKKLTTQGEEYFPVSPLNWGPESKYMWEQKQQQIVAPTTTISYKSYGY